MNDCKIYAECRGDMSEPLNPFPKKNDDKLQLKYTIIHSGF